MMRIALPSFFLLSFLFQTATGFGAVQSLQRHQSKGTYPTSTTLHVLPIDTQTSVEISNTAHSMWVATIDADIANIQLEEFRKVFAGGIAVMVGGLISTTLLGTIIEKKDLYANLAAESYIDMADDPAFWKQMTEGMSPEEKEKTKVLMAKIKAQREGDAGGQQPLAMASEDAETSSSVETESTTQKDEAVKASNDMFSDY